MGMSSLVWSHFQTNKKTNNNNKERSNKTKKESENTIYLLNVIYFQYEKAGIIYAINVRDSLRIEDSWKTLTPIVASSADISEDITSLIRPH